PPPTTSLTSNWPPGAPPPGGPPAATQATTGAPPPPPPPQPPTPPAPPALRRVEAQLDHATLIPDTEKFALKSPDRFKEKLAKMIRTEPDRPATDLAAEIHEGIRYTYSLGFE